MLNHPEGEWAYGMYVGRKGGGILQMPLVALNLKFRVLRRVNAFLMAKIEIFVVFNSKVIRERETIIFIFKGN